MGHARGDRRRRGHRGRPAAQARPDLAIRCWAADIAAEGFTRLTYEIEEDDGGVTRLTVTHELEGAPVTLAQMVAGDARCTRAPAAAGRWILSDLKSLLETGSPLGG